ncbi:rhodanese-like domain-containing protein [Indiicoccus explosivorum]|uniref:rhodanese-like domain-containing protein n=1 Tax=Indiicoccus explosivorum TaxID=1917864 RepID=UPI000B44B952|nr:rhodanese-like domain-containing protein [Indiicoccus explosivorum]
MKTMTAEELREKIETGERIAVLDVREDEEVAYGMIPGALHIPLGEIPARAAELETGAGYAVICRSGGRSAHACAFLESEGFEVTNVEGGMLEWTGETIAK